MTVFSVCDGQEVKIQRMQSEKIIHYRVMTLLTKFQFRLNSSIHKDKLVVKDFNYKKAGYIMVNLSVEQRH